MRQKKEWKREWHFERYFSGMCSRLFPLEYTEEDVIRALDAKFNDSWRPLSLRRGKKKKGTKKKI